MDEKNLIEKVIAGWKSFFEINLFYFKEKTNLGIFIYYLIYILPLAIMPYVLSSIFKYALSTRNFILILITICFIISIVLSFGLISYSLISIIFIKIETYRQKHKNNFIDKFLGKVEKFESFFKEVNKNKTRTAILYILKILIMLIMFIILTIISISTKLFIITILTFFVCLLLISMIVSFIVDLLTLVKNQFAFTSSLNWEILTLIKRIIGLIFIIIGFYFIFSAFGTFFTKFNAWRIY